ncbi:MAG: ATP-binding protein [Myxococcales bacterium]|nr:ATP-binding protein [Myxococcales bacterium]
MSTSADSLLQLVVESAAVPLLEGTARDLEIPVVRGKATVLLGMRRTGKSSLLMQRAYGKMAKGGATREQIALFNFDNIAFEDFTGRDLLALVEAWRKQFPQMRTAKLYLFLDEIQQIQRWERALRELIESPLIDVTVTGSSAKLLSTEISTSLRGRSLATEVWPFSLRETLRHTAHSVPANWPVTKRAQSELESLFERYVVRGGFPEVVTLPDLTWSKVLREYLDVTLMRDVIERHSVSNPNALRTFVRQLLRASGRKVSINKMSRDMASQHIEVGKNTLHDYVAYLQDAYCFFFVPIFSDSVRKQQVNPKKCYSIDPGFVNANTAPGHFDRGLALETLVYIELRRRGHQPFYGDFGRGEIDFIIGSDGEPSALMQVAWSIADETTRARELKPLWDAAKKWPKAKLTVVTAYETDQLKDNRHHIEVVPFYRWALQG